MALTHSLTCCCVAEYNELRGIECALWDFATPCCCVAGEGLLGRFLEVLMRRLLLDSGAGELTGLAADALLPLILAHPQAYQHIGRCRH